MAPSRSYIAPFPRPSSAPSARGTSRASSAARLRHILSAEVGIEVTPACEGSTRHCSAVDGGDHLEGTGRQSLSPWRRNLGVRPTSCTSRKSAWTPDGRRRDRWMPKLTRQQRAWGAKEKLDRLSAPALRELRMNLANVRAWMQSGQVVEKAVEVQKEEEPLGGPMGRGAGDLRPCEPTRGRGRGRGSGAPC
ncbi:unnamed protein product [Durusdinium trenchii]|uniref:Uncharacterized protein n=2 Tax=Durusdinium trenchii TaxID=1381693 RepID=A0ABP0SFV6_9DINO